jgi:hypothetical protein
MGMRRRAAAAGFALGAALTLAACDDFSLVAVTATPNLAALPSLPPIGFNHRFGNNPVASADAFKLERSLFSNRVFWEVAIRTDPIQAGYVSLANKQKVQAARHAATDLYLVIATEDRFTIEGMLAYRTDNDQERYCESLLGAIVKDGYDSITTGYVLVYFTESDQHAKLTWTKKGGYRFAVYDNDLRGTSLAPGPSATALPTPAP